MNNLTDFINESLYPALWERIDSAFPELNFQRRGGEWRSSHKLDGSASSPSREDKTVVTKKKPHLIHEQGGETYSLVDFQLVRTGHVPGAKGAELVEALRSLAGICGLELPEGDSEEYKEYKERQERYERLASEMKTALFTPEGADVLAYLTDVRKYTLEEIKAMELGFCSQEIASQLEEAPYGAGEKYLLSLPYRSSGRILGFKLRAITDEVKPKYKNTSGLPKKASLFGLTGLRLSGNGKRDRDIAIVEGELDALYAQVKGVENIVSSTGVDGISLEALQEAKRRGVKRATIVVDYEETKKERDEKESKILTAIHTIHRAGLTSFVAELPARADGKKEDVDSYLHSHSKEELTKILDSASTGANYLFERIYNRAVEKQGGAETITDKSYNDYKEETIALLNDVEVVSPVDREIILSTFARSTDGAGITKEALQEEADRRKAVADKQRQEKKAKELLVEASTLANEGRVEESLQLLQEKASSVLKIAKETELAKLLALPTAEGIREKLRIRPKGVETNYYFSKGKKSERLTLPSGAVTLVCAPPSHGKSTLLRNLALETAGNGEPGVVLYFTFEEDLESTIVELVNTYAGLELTSPSRDYNNLTTIGEYYREGSTRYMKSESVKSFQEREAKFMKEYIESGSLRVFDGDYYAEELVEAIQYLAHALKVKAVFIDYVQLLYKQGNKLQRNEELKAIAKSLRQLAKKETLPIVLAGQLNRDAKSPTEMHSQNIADSADLEREANTVILLWSSSFSPINGSSYNEQAIEDCKRMELGKEGYIYGKLSKNRYGKANIDARFFFEGNTGKIESNAPQKDEEEGEEELFKEKF